MRKPHKWALPPLAVLRLLQALLPQIMAYNKLATSLARLKIGYTS